MDRSWSPLDNEQAEGRLERIGQKNAVQIITIEAVNTIDQYIANVLSTKREWLLKILGGD